MGRERRSIYDTAYQYYLKGASLQEVAELLGVTRQCVYKAFKRRGFALRGIFYEPYQVYDGRKFTLRPTGYYALTTDDRCLMHRYVWETEGCKIPEGWDIHHIDGDRANNSIDNLECLPKSEHTRLYSPRHNQYTKCRS